MMLDKDYEKPFDMLVASGCFMFARTKALEKEHGFDQRFFLYFEDNDLSRRIREQGRIVLLPAKSVIHYWNRTSRKSKKVLFIMLRSARKYFFKWSFMGKRSRRRQYETAH